MSNITEEIKKRRTFAIISHPDAGKTTLTEKFLLYGGAINLAGTVKGRKAAKHAVSDWMEIEKERGISVTSSVMQFEYDGYCINILDTPGHQDFSEDTYRTLMAADSAVMVIDGSKGVEAQTIKLFKVCVMRGIPIFTFINKMDREARDPFELMDEIENVLGIRTCPINWPIGCGKNFKGVYDRHDKTITTFTAAMGGAKEVATQTYSLEDGQLDSVIGADYHSQLLDEIELLDGAADEFDLDRVSRGNLSPVFFGSALTNFGVETFLQHFLKMTTSPLPRGGSVQGGFLRFCVQDPGQHEQGPPGPDRVHADRIRQIRGGHGSEPRPGRQEAALIPAPADDGPGPEDRGGGLCRRHHRRVRSGHLFHRRHPVSVQCKV